MLYVQCNCTVCRSIQYFYNHIFSNFSYNIFSIHHILNINVIVQSYYIQILSDKKRLCLIGFTSKKVSDHFAKFKQVKNLIVIILSKSKNLVVI